MDHLYTPKEWLKFIRSGAIVALVASLLLFRDSPHTASEISVAIAVPLIIFNCMPLVLMGILKAMPRKTRLVAFGIIGILVIVIIGFFAAVSILLASFAYAALSIPWAITPARHLSYILLAISALPIIAAISFLAGIYSRRLRDSALLRFVSVKARQPSTYWPTMA